MGRRDIFASVPMTTPHPHPADWETCCNVQSGPCDSSARILPRQIRARVGAGHSVQSPRHGAQQAQLTKVWPSCGSYHAPSSMAHAAFPGTLLLSQESTNHMRKPGHDVALSQGLPATSMTFFQKAARRTHQISSPKSSTTTATANRRASLFDGGSISCALSCTVSVLSHTSG